MPKTIKKEKQDTYYHNMLKYVSLILRIKKMIYSIKNLKGRINFTMSISQGNMSSTLNDLNNLFSEKLNLLKKS